MLFAAFGYRRPLLHARTARVLKVGIGWHGCKCSCQDIDIFWCFQNNRAPPVAAVKGISWDFGTFAGTGFATWQQCLSRCGSCELTKLERLHALFL